MEEPKNKCALISQVGNNKIFPIGMTMHQLTVMDWNGLDPWMNLGNTCVYVATRIV